MRDKLIEIILRTAGKDAEYFLSQGDNRRRLRSLLELGAETALRDFLALEMQSLEENNMDAALEGNGLFNPDSLSMKELYFSDDNLPELYYETALNSIVNALREPL